MSRLPVIDEATWINPGNRPDKETAAGTRIGPSRLGSIGGKGVHTLPRGIDALMTAPRPYKEAPVKVPLKVQAAAAGAEQVKPQPRIQCPHCPLWFQSANEAHSHARLCARVQVVTGGPGVEDLAKLWESQRLKPDYVPAIAPKKQITVLIRHERGHSRAVGPPVPVPKVPRQLPPPPKPNMCPLCGTWFPCRTERRKHYDVCAKIHKRDYFYSRWCDDGGAVARDD